MSEQRRPKGTGSIRERGDGVQARVSYIDPATGKRRQRSAKHPNRTEARQWLNAQLAAIQEGQITDGSITLGQYLEDWLGSLGMQSLEAATVSWYTSAVRRHIVPQPGHVRLDRLTATQIEAFLAERASSGRLPRNGKDGKPLDQPKGLGSASVRRL